MNMSVQVPTLFSSMNRLTTRVSRPPQLCAQKKKNKKIFKKKKKHFQRSIDKRVNPYIVTRVRFSLHITAVQYLLTTCHSVKKYYNIMILTSSYRRLWLSRPLTLVPKIHKSQSRIIRVGSEFVRQRPNSLVPIPSIII